ncbi:endolytic transglycosylase MltG [Microlunatus spumicola]|uniref:Endolytic murein transglycosylase n=2 Tax=Microlunatus spumicola TaxID=81499 RepID=A0ABP6WPV1_9ACTN
MSSMLPDTKPSAAQEVIHQGKGCLAVLLALAVLVVGGFLVYDQGKQLISGFGETPDYTGSGVAPITVTIPTGATLDEIGDVLKQADVVKSAQAWDNAVASEERATSIQPGRYLMRTQMAAINALRLLINPGESRVRAQFTIPEGLRLSRQVDALAKGTKIKKSAYQAALKNPKKLGLPSYAKNRPEGFLFPDTYELTADATATSTLKQMVSQYKAVTADIGLNAAAKKLDRSPYEVLIVASIIEREVNQDQYRAKVARVLYNRLDEGMPLGLDSTVIYAENLNTNTTTPKDRASKSKYNTYLRKGLPPGPIAAPGKAALEAAANPEPGKWLYFTTVDFDSGETKFAETDAEFQQIVAQFQAWCQSHPGRCDS